MTARLKRLFYRWWYGKDLYDFAVLSVRMHEEKRP